MDGGTTFQNWSSSIFLLEKRRRERGDLVSTSFPQALPKTGNYCILRDRVLGIFAGMSSSACLPLSLVQLELQSAPLFPSQCHAIQLCRSLSAPMLQTLVEASTVTIMIFRASAFIFLTGTLRNSPSQSSSSALSTSLFSHLVGVPGWRSS